METQKLFGYIIILNLFLLLSVSCTGNPTPPQPTDIPVITETPIRPTQTLMLPTPMPTLTWTPTPIPPTPTPNYCLGSTVAGSRQKFEFEEIVPCLNTPEKLITFMSGNLKWDSGWDKLQYGENTYSPAFEVYENGTDDCDGMAEFAACLLKKNGYEAYNVAISIRGPGGHNVAGFIGEDGLKYSINNGEELIGPYNSWEELAQYYIDLGIATPPNGVLWLFSPCISRRAIGEQVIQLEHTVLR